MAEKAPKKSAGKKKKANGYAMPGHIPKGQILTDTSKVSWIIDTSIGVGGFGEIYGASKADSPAKKDYVVKIEPLENGPLFCERNVYVRIGKRETIEEFMQLRKLKTIGMPQFYGFGSHDVGDTKYRFLVLERYGKNLWNIFLENGKIFPVLTVYKVALQILDVLEFMHSRGYVHADIKGANLLLGRGKAESQVFLVDLGLASRYSTTAFKPDPRSAHNGTIEYTSRDAHQGVSTRRGDVEILGYNMVHWAASSLPWEKLKTPQAVQAAKERHMADVDGLMKACFKTAPQPGALKAFLQLVASMEPLEEPDYGTLRRTLQTAIKQQGRVDDKLVFTSRPAAKSPAKQRASPRKKEAESAARNSPRPPRKVLKRRSLSLELPKPQQEPTVKRSWRDAPTIVNGAKPTPAEGKPLAVTAPKRKKRT